MLDALQEYLKTATPAEYQIQVEEAHRWYERFGLEGYELEFTDLLMTVDNADSGQFQDELTNLVIRLQKNILQQMQIELAEDLTIAKINEVLKFISDIEDTELVDDVCSIIEGQTDATDRFCQLMALLNSTEPEVYYDVVHSVPEVLLTKIKETVQMNELDDDVPVIDVELNRQLLAKLRTFIDTMGNKPPIVYNLMVDGLSPGLKFEEYYEKITPFLASSDPNKAAYELISAAMISRDIPGSPRDVIAQSLNDTFTSLDIITPFLVSLDQMFLDFNSKLKSGIKEITV